VPPRLLVVTPQSRSGEREGRSPSQERGGWAGSHPEGVASSGHPGHVYLRREL